MTNTTNYGLKKPGYDDGADIAIINQNMDTIDTQLFSVGSVSSDIKTIVQRIEADTQDIQNKVVTVDTVVDRVEADTNDIQSRCSRIEADTQDIQSKVNNINSQFPISGGTDLSATVGKSTTEGTYDANRDVLDIVGSGWLISVWGADSMVVRIDGGSICPSIAQSSSIGPVTCWFRFNNSLKVTAGTAGGNCTYVLD